MLYEITVLEFVKGKKKRIFSMEVWAKDLVEAVEKACIFLGPDRVVDIKELHFERPKVNRVARDGVI